nr:L,D-transpeptidase family protein [Sphingosinicella terrae]
MAPTTAATAQPAALWSAPIVHGLPSNGYDLAPAATEPARPAALWAGEPGEDLDPGEFVWRPELSMEGEVEVVVSIPQQIAYVYRGGTLIGVTTVSTGRRGHTTPTGSFPILEKRREHYSNLYNNAPMPFMQRLTWDGIALHAGHIPGTPASHGCVRLPLAFSRHLFGATRVGATVHIIGDEARADTALALARGEPVAPTAPAATMPIASAASPWVLPARAEQ